MAKKTFKDTAKEILRKIKFDLEMGKDLLHREVENWNLPQKFVDVRETEYEHALECATRLRNAGFPFSLTIVEPEGRPKARKVVCMSGAFTLDLSCGLTKTKDTKLVRLLTCESELDDFDWVNC